MKFTKMQGAGNDYIYVNCFEQQVVNPNELAKKVSDRHFGIGSDGLVLICPSQVADFRMDMFNSDGSQAEMCGNAIRCVGKYVYDRHLTDKTVITVETLAGIKTLWLNIEEGVCVSVRVDMGEPILQPEKVPVNFTGDVVVNQPVSILGNTYGITCVSMGNPHAVTFLPEVEDLPLEQIGPKFEHYEQFPARINTEFVKVIDRGRMRMRVWERGAGETWACGTGACATLVAAVLNDKTDRSAEIILNGGSLFIEWNEENNHVYMTGPAVTVFDGEINA